MTHNSDLSYKDEAELDNSNVKTTQKRWQYDGDHLGSLLSADQSQPRPQGVANEAQQGPRHQLSPGAQVEEMLVLPLTRRMLNVV